MWFKRTIYSNTCIWWPLTMRLCTKEQFSLQSNPVWSRLNWFIITQLEENVKNVFRLKSEKQIRTLGDSPRMRRSLKEKKKKNEHQIPFTTARNPFFLPTLATDKFPFRKCTSKKSGLIAMDCWGFMLIKWNTVKLHILIHYGLISFPNRFVFENPRFALSLRELSYKSARNVSKANLFSEIT